MTTEPAETPMAEDFAFAEYSAVFRAAPDGILVVDPDGVIRDVNPRALEQFGYDRHDLIVQEALDNVTRHADAGVVEIRLRRYDGRTRVTVEDDGRGFPVEETREREWLGLFEMEERAATVGARVEIDSAPGDGTRVEIVAPVEAAEG